MIDLDTLPPMMLDTVRGALDRVLNDEGGVKDVGDGKGITRYGQTPRWLKQFRLPVPKSREMAETNYIEWLLFTGLFGVCRTTPLAYALITFAVHAGNRRAVKALQKVVGAKQDGKIGPRTEFRVSSNTAREMASKLVAEYTRYLGRLLGSKRYDRRRYASGWCNRIARLQEALR